MVGMPKVYILGVGMGSKMIALLCWNWFVFYASVLKNDIYIYIYILETLLENKLILSKNAGKTFTESCNNPVFQQKNITFPVI